MKVPESVQIVIASAGLVAGLFGLAAGNYRYKQAKVMCPGMSGANGFVQQYDSVYKDPEASGTVLVAKDRTRVMVPGNCLVTLKPYRHA